MSNKFDSGMPQTGFATISSAGNHSDHSCDAALPQHSHRAVETRGVIIVMLAAIAIAAAIDLLARMVHRYVTLMCFIPLTSEAHGSLNANSHLGLCSMILREVSLLSD